MKAEIPDLATVLNKQAKPLISYIWKTALTEPVVKFIGKKKLLKIECASESRSGSIIVDANLKQDGVAYLMASSLVNIKSSHKKAIISVTDDKMTITSDSKARKLKIQINLVGSDTYLKHKTGSKEITAGELGKIDLEYLQKAIGKIAISPILVPGVDFALLTMTPFEEKGFRIYINDGLRVSMIEIPKSKIVIKEPFATDFGELNDIIAVMSSITDKASLIFTNKSMVVKGMNEAGENIALIKTNHSVPKDEKGIRARTAVENAQKQSMKMSFIPNEDFVEVLENVIGIANLKSNQGFLDIAVKKTGLTISGSGPSTSYNESMQLKKVKGTGIVRIQGSVLSDIARKLGGKSLVKVNANGIVINNREKNADIFFVLPFLSLKQ
jgi:hypothetical protein